MGREKEVEGEKVKESTWEVRNGVEVAEVFEVVDGLSKGA